MYIAQSPLSRSALRSAPADRRGAASAASHHPQPRFGNVSGLISAMVDKLENRTVELLVTDVGGMGVPRTSLEFFKRGPDAARENFIRDMSGTVFNMFVIGWFSRLMLKAFGDKVGPLNPLGVNHRAWIDAGMAETLGQIYRQTLAEAAGKTPVEVERAFAANVLKQLSSADGRMGQNAIEQALAAMDTAAAATADGAVTGEAREALRRRLENPDYAGKLTPETAERVTDRLMAARNRLDEATGAVAADRAALDLPAETLKERLRRSLGLLGKAEVQQLEALDQQARLGGLSQQVNVLSQEGDVLLKNRGRQSTLKQLYYFMEEVVDRAHQGVDTITDASRADIEARLFGQADEAGKGLLKRLLPSQADGLVNYIVKSKRLYTILPMILTISASISVAFVNNWLTKRKNGGQVYFPGEGRNGGAPKPAAAAAAAQATAAAPQAAPAVSGLSGRQGVFNQFVQSRAGVQPGGTM